MVLIETLWNVKDLRRSIFLQGTGFNRNIVECKVFYSTFPNLIWLCFNRNIVECKGTKITNEFYDSIVLIETLWNVMVLE